MDSFREVPYNYTSASDESIVKEVLNDEAWTQIEILRKSRETGVSARLLMRFIGDLFIHLRNPYLYHEMMYSKKRRYRFFTKVERELGGILEKAEGNQQAKTLIESALHAARTFNRDLKASRRLQARMHRHFSRIISSDQFSFEPFDLVAHITDATDWRRYAPIAILRPENVEEIPSLIEVIKKLNLKLIVRGGGTGLTGGAVPLHPRTVIINTEKLNRISDIESVSYTNENGELLQTSILRVEVGAITDHVIAFAKKRGFIFATDPTSAWASTIGGNISENAGGKKAVKWGVAIDNIFSYRMAFPDGSIREIKRKYHPLRKIEPDDQVVFEIYEKGSLYETLSLRGDEIRKRGLGKDVTNKRLGGLPGFQKEGVDGVILDASFVLYPPFRCKKTLCLEFFGPDMNEACFVIENILKSFDSKRESPSVTAMEHFDRPYIIATQYRVKAATDELPQAVLLIDVEGNSFEDLEQGLKAIEASVKEGDQTYFFPAKDDEEADKFWQDRKKLGAIAARTNAFKLNEDIVLPITGLAPFISFCDKINHREKKKNQQAAKKSLIRYFETLDLTDKKMELARTLVEKSTSSEEIKKRLHDLFRGYDEWIDESLSLYEHERDRRLIVATHMHAGDGNVHVNIPVFSNDPIMMKAADQIVDEVMDQVTQLGGVITGEHGVGITKIKYMDPSRIHELNLYRDQVDRDRLMNPFKLDSKDVLSTVYTPSFNLLGLEARILKHSQLEVLLKKISNCVRCGKCKDDCCVFYPGTLMFYHPRNKNLAIFSLAEAILYDSQRERNSKFKLLKALGEIADHCTMCHRCLKPCPVKIDSGESAQLERNILALKGFKKKKPLTALTLFYLESTSKIFNSIFRFLVLRWGLMTQQAAATFYSPFKEIKPFSKWYIFSLIRSKQRAASSEALSDSIESHEPHLCYSFDPEGEDKGAVFYFPGCGSERLFSSISKAAIYLLTKNGYRVIIPPSNLCCGFPHEANAKQKSYQKITLRNTIILSQIREMFKNIEFNSFLITCGTCRSAVESMNVDEIFNASIESVSGFLVDRGLSLNSEFSALYHAPCHDSLNSRGPSILKKVGVRGVESLPHCCSESGTMPLSRPDISQKIREKKWNDDHSIETLKAFNGDTILTNCPSCLSGLDRYDSELKSRHIIEFLASKTSSEWEKEFKKLSMKAQAVRY